MLRSEPRMAVCKRTDVSPLPGREGLGGRVELAADSTAPDLEWVLAPLQATSALENR